MSRSALTSDAASAVSVVFKIVTDALGRGETCQRPGGATSRRPQRQLENPGRHVPLQRFIFIRQEFGDSCRSAKSQAYSVRYGSA